MADPFIRSRINNLPLLQQLPPEQLDLIAEAFDAYQFQPNEIVFRQGYPAQGLYVFVNGLAHLTRATTDGREQLVAEVRGGQYLGEAALFRPMNENTSLRVIEQAVVLFLSRARFSEVIARAPEIRANLNSKFVPAPPPMSVPPSVSMPDGDGGATAAVPVTPSATPSDTFRPAFKGQRPNEVILIFQRRRHWWALVRASLLPIFLGLALIVVGLLTAGTGFSWVFFIVAVVLTGVWIGYLFYDWSDDYVIITDQRLIHEENTLFGLRESISEIPFSAIQEASYSIPAGDPFAQAFRYGTLEIKTAGTASNMRLPFISDPQKMQQLIFSYRQNYQSQARAQNRDSIRTEVDRFLQARGVVTPAAQTPQAQSTPAPKPTATQTPWLATRYINADGEIVYRKHLSVWAMHISLPLFVLFAGIVLVLLALLSVSIAELGVLQSITGVALIVLGGVWVYLADWDWRKDMYIIGDNSIKIIHKRPLWLQDTTEQMTLTQIDNVISDRAGIFDTLLDRGSVRIFLLGDNTPKVLAAVHEPAAIQDEISNRRAAVLDHARKVEVQNQHRAITEYLDVYHERVNALNAARSAPTAPQSPDNNPPSNSSSSSPSSRDGSRPPRIPRVRND
jgi:membrane protein YdbS with pleckstrin-like domain